MIETKKVFSAPSSCRGDYHCIIIVVLYRERMYTFDRFYRNRPIHLIADSISMNVKFYSSKHHKRVHYGYD